MQLDATLPAMTTTEEPEGVAAYAGKCYIRLWTLEQGGGVMEVSWHSPSPWVPNGTIQLSTNDQTVVALTAGQIVEGVIRQLRPVLQSMVQEIWQPF